MRYKQKCWVVLPKRLLKQVDSARKCSLSLALLFAFKISSCLTVGKLLKIHICTDSFHIKVNILFPYSQGYDKSVFLMT